MPEIDTNLYKLPHGQMINHINKNETEFLYKEIFQDNTYLKYGINLKKDACVFDVGANIGMFSLFVLSNAPNASVFAFEPVPEVFEILKSNVTLHNLNVKLFNSALSDYIRKKSFTYYPKSSLQSGYYANKSEDRNLLKATALQYQTEQGLAFNSYLLEKLVDSKLEAKIFSCLSVTLEHIIEQYNIKKIDLLKVDVEKSELDVIKGIGNSWDKIEQIVIEVDNKENLKSINFLLERNGFIVNTEQYDLLSNTSVYMLYAKRHDAI